jgi:hypothetical protein
MNALARVAEFKAVPQHLVDADKIIKRSNALFVKKLPLLTLWQELCEHFHPERADMTQRRTVGTDYYRMLFESIPPQYARDLAGAVGAIMRPRGRPWFKCKAPEDGAADNDNTAPLYEQFTHALRRALYQRGSLFQKAASLADLDFVVIGNACTSFNINFAKGLFTFTTHHMRDVAWVEGRDGDVRTVFRKVRRSMEAHAEEFGEEALSPNMRKALDKDPYAEHEILHGVMPSENARSIAKVRPGQYLSVYLDPNDKFILSYGTHPWFPYWIRRWQRSERSAYGYSPASYYGIIDARTLQTQAQTILEAAEKQVDPPLIATRDSVLGGPNTYAGGITWVDPDYDERLGEALRPLQTGGNIKLGVDLKLDTRQNLNSAWFLNRLFLPSDHEKTAFETQQLVNEYVRSATPLFEPFEDDNRNVLDTMFALLKHFGVFGNPQEWPEGMRGQDVEYDFDTPIQTAYSRAEAMTVQEAIQAMAPLAQMSPSVIDNFDFDMAARLLAKKLGASPTILVPADVVSQGRQTRAQTAAKDKAAAQAAELGKALPAATQGMMQAPAAASGLAQLFGQGQLDAETPIGI